MGVGLSRRRALGLVVAGAAAGCVPAERRPVVMDAVIPPDLVWVMEDGAALPVRVWRPAGPVRGAVLALHGFGDSRDAWEMPAPWFAQAGWVVFAPDQRGFGAAPGRGYWAGSAQLVADAAACVARVRAAEPGVPLVLMGESMGGAVAMLLAAGRPAIVDRVVLLAPAVWTRDQMGPLLSGSLWAARRFAPDWRLTGREVPLYVTASDNRDALLRLTRDPLTLRSARVSLVAGLADLMDRAAEAAPRLPTTGVLALAGRRDQIVPPASTAAAWRRMPAGVRRAFYPDGYHLLLRDRDRDLVRDDILAWLDDPGGYLPSAADVATAGWLADHGWSGGPAGVLPATGLDGVEGRPVWPY